MPLNSLDAGCNREEIVRKVSQKLWESAQQKPFGPAKEIRIKPNFPVIRLN